MAMYAICIVEVKTTYSFTTIIAQKTSKFTPNSDNIIIKMQNKIG